MKAKKEKVFYVALYDLKNGIRKHEKFPESRLSKFVINDFENRGKIRRVLSKRELKQEYDHLAELFEAE